MWIRVHSEDGHVSVLDHTGGFQEGAVATQGEYKFNLWVLQVLIGQLVALFDLDLSSAVLKCLNHLISHCDMDIRCFSPTTVDNQNQID